jgi:hypothetical protein
MYTLASALFLKSLLVSQQLGTPSCLLLCCYLVAIRTSLVVPVCLLDAFRHVSGTGRHFLPLFHRGSYPGSGLALHSSSMLIILSLHRVGGDRLPRNFLALIL